MSQSTALLLSLLSFIISAGSVNGAPPVRDVTFRGANGRAFVELYGGAGSSKFHHTDLSVEGSAGPSGDSPGRQLYVMRTEVVSGVQGLLDALYEWLMSPSNVGQ